MAEKGGAGAPVSRPAAPQEQVEGLLAVAGSSTSAAVQRAIARLLGGPRQVADAAVASVAEAGLLAHGIALPALVAAARRGVDAVGGLELLARGERIPASWSDYEARAARDEALEEAADALRRLPRAERSVALTGDDAPLAAAEALLEGVSHARIDTLAGRAASGSGLLLAAVNYRWIRDVLSSASVAVSTVEADDPFDQLVESALARPQTPGHTGAAVPAAGESLEFDGRVLRRTEDYLDPFEDLAAESAKNAVDAKKPR